MNDPYWPDDSAEAYELALANLPRIPDTKFAVTLTSRDRAMEVFGEHTWLRYCFDDGALNVSISSIEGETSYTAEARPDVVISAHWFIRAYYPPTRST